MWNRRQRLATRSGLPLRQIERLLGRYGAHVVDLLDLIESDAALADPIPGGGEYLKAEAVYAASHEGALHLEDVLGRRTRISFETRDRGAAAAPEVAHLIAPVLGWDTATQQAETEGHLRRATGEQAAERQPDDDAANEARLRPYAERLAS